MYHALELLAQERYASYSASDRRGSEVRAVLNSHQAALAAAFLLLLAFELAA